MGKNLFGQLRLHTPMNLFMFDYIHSVKEYIDSLSEWRFIPLALSSAQRSITSVLQHSCGLLPAPAAGVKIQNGEECGC